MAAKKNEKQTVTIDGKEYDFEKLSEEAKKQLINIRACDEEIARRQRQTVIAQAARAGFAKILKEELDK